MLGRWRSDQKASRYSRKLYYRDDVERVRVEVIMMIKDGGGIDGDRGPKLSVLLKCEM